MTDSRALGLRLVADLEKIQKDFFALRGRFQQVKKIPALQDRKKITADITALYPDFSDITSFYSDLFLTRYYAEKLSNLGEDFSTQQISFDKCYNTIATQVGVLRNMQRERDSDMYGIALLEKESQLDQQVHKKLKQFLIGVLQNAAFQYYVQHVKGKQDNRKYFSDYFGNVAVILMLKKKTQENEVAGLGSDLGYVESLSFSQDELEGMTLLQLEQLIQHVYLGKDTKMIYCLEKAYEDQKKGSTFFDMYFDHQLPGSLVGWGFFTLKPAAISLVANLERVKEHTEICRIKWDGKIKEWNSSINGLGFAIAPLEQHTKNYLAKRKEIFAELQEKAAKHKLDSLFELWGKLLQEIAALTAYLKENRDRLHEKYSPHEKMNADCLEGLLSEIEKLFLDLDGKQSKLVQLFVQSLDSARIVQSRLAQMREQLGSSEKLVFYEEKAEELNNKYDVSIQQAMSVLNNIKDPSADKVKHSFNMLRESWEHFNVVRSELSQSLEKQKQKIIVERDQRQVLAIELLHLIKRVVTGEENAIFWQQAVKPDDRCFNWGSFSKVNNRQVPGGIKELNVLFAREDDITKINYESLFQQINDIVQARLRRAGDLRYRLFVRRDPVTDAFYHLLKKLPEPKKLTQEGVAAFEADLARLGHRDDLHLNLSKNVHNEFQVVLNKV